MEHGCVSETLETAKEEVQKLYDFRDHYFERVDISRAKYKNEDVEKQLQETLKCLEQLKDQFKNKAEFLMLKGKALNVLPDYNPEAQELLSKAVKLDPNLVEAWVQLGEVYWKNSDMEAAKNCFVGALSHSEDKVALRNLSMVLRQLGKTPQERRKLTEESIQKAKKALQLDGKDGTSWFILGNGYLSLFFDMGQNSSVLKHALGAYQQAESDPVSKNNPDLHYNRATLYKYEENYKAALEGFSKAADLDPTWEEAATEKQKIISYLDHVSEFIEKKGKVRAKKLAAMCDSIKDSDLGPFAGGNYTSAKGESVKLNHVLFENLSAGQNSEMVVVGKVVCSVNHNDPIPFTFCLVDKAGTCLAVTLYNIIPGYGVKIGDSVAVAEPFLNVVDFTYENKVYKFKSIRVNSPVTMVINGRKQGLDKEAPSFLSFDVMSE